MSSWVKALLRESGDEEQRLMIEAATEMNGKAGDRRIPPRPPARFAMTTRLA